MLNGIRGLMDIRHIQEAFALLTIPRKEWHIRIERFAIASVRAFSFLHQIRPSPSTSTPTFTEQPPPLAPLLPPPVLASPPHTSWRRLEPSASLPGSSPCSFAPSFASRGRGGPTSENAQPPLSLARVNYRHIMQPPHL
jgi:hypothetical protein